MEIMGFFFNLKGYIYPSNIHTQGLKGILNHCFSLHDWWSCGSFKSFYELVYRLMEWDGISVPTAVKSSRNPVTLSDISASTLTRSLTSVPSVSEPSPWRARWPPTSRPTQGSRTTSVTPAINCSPLRGASKFTSECTQVTNWHQHHMTW